MGQIIERVQSGQAPYPNNNHEGFARGREVLVRGNIELRLGDAEKDADELSRLFNQPSSLPHLSGTAPHRLSEHERQEIDRKYPILPIVTATSGDVTKYYERRDDLILVVAEDSSNKGKLFGSLTIQIGNPGVLAANIARLVVDEEQRGQRIAGHLIKAANAFIFEGIKFNQANASIILKVKGEELPQRAFRREFYRSLSEEGNRCVSWDSEKGGFEERNVLPMKLERSDYYLNTTEEETKEYLSIFTSLINNPLKSD